MSKYLAFVIALLAAGVVSGEDSITFKEDTSEYILNFPLVKTCYEWRIDYTEPCPEGYGPIRVDTPTSDLKAQHDICEESIGVLIDCGRIVDTEVIPDWCNVLAEGCTKEVTWDGEWCRCPGLWSRTAEEPADE